jgi:HK97 family phage portal protein
LGFFDIFRREPKSQDLIQAQVLSGSIPIYTSWERDVYADDAVQSAIQCIVNEIKKLQPQHIRRAEGSGSISIFDSSIQRVIENPNPLMTTSELIEKSIWQLFNGYNSFIIPTYSIRPDGIRNYTGLWPIKPLTVEFEENKQGDLFIVFTFSNGFRTTLLYSDVIHLRYKFSASDYFGGDANGKPDNRSLNDTLNLNKSLLEGITKTMQSAGNINGVIKYNSMLDKGKTEANMKEFNQLLKNNESGVLPLDLKAEYQDIKRDIKFVDADTVKFIDEKILRYFGVPLTILTGDYTPQQFEAFYSKTLEPLIIAMSQAFTKALFTPRERGYGNSIVFHPGSMVFMTTSEKLELSRILGDRGSIYENELRTAFGMPPIPELDGVRMVSLNYINSAIASEYQLNQPNDGIANSKGKEIDHE